MKRRIVNGATLWRITNPDFYLQDDVIGGRRPLAPAAIGLLDLRDGRRLWTAPDPGLPGSSAGWECAVAGDLVAVMGATGDRPYVLVFDARTGRQLARRGGRLTGIGEDWVMVSTGVGAEAGRLSLHMLTS